MGKTILKNIQALLRAFFFVVIIITYLMTAGVFYPFYNRNPMKIRKILCQIVSFYCKLGIKLLGFKITENYLENRLELVDRNFLYVSNHLSYMDILVMCSNHPACFVTSVEMRDIFFLGHLCKLAGCVFVERRNKQNLGGEVAEITEALKSGLSVVIFPEATSTNGESVLRFKRPLFRASQDSGVEVLPLTVNYTHLDGEPVSKTNRDKVCWYGDMTFADHLFALFKVTQTKARLTIGKMISPREFDSHEEPLNDFVQQAHTSVSSQYKPFI